MLIDKLIALNPNGVWRADVEAPSNEEEFYANTYKWSESTGEWVNLTSSDVTWADLNVDQVKADTAMEIIRMERGYKLKDSDWSQGADVPDSLKAAYTTYRQALRDMPANNSSATITDNDMTIANVTWPTEPE
tara:strand:+ start:7800 stop:8198 length:399 start_codon:yes stop_codon:yes gene_type:complete